MPDCIAPRKAGGDDEVGGAVARSSGGPKPPPKREAVALSRVEWERLRVWIDSKKNVIQEQRWTPEEVALIAINHKVVKACNGENIREMAKYVGIAFQGQLVDPLLVSPQVAASAA